MFHELDEVLREHFEALHRHSEIFHDHFDLLHGHSEMFHERLEMFHEHFDHDFLPVKRVVIKTSVLFVEVTSLFVTKIQKMSFVSK